MDDTVEMLLEDLKASRSVENKRESKVSMNIERKRSKKLIQTDTLSLKLITKSPKRVVLTIVYIE